MQEVIKVEEKLIFKKVSVSDIYHKQLTYRSIGITQEFNGIKYEIDAMYEVGKESRLLGYKLTPHEDFFDNLSGVLFGSKSTQFKQELYYIYEKKEEL